MNGRLLVPAALLAVLTGCGGEPPPEPEQIRPVRAIKVGDVEAFDQSFLPGRARAFHEVDLSFRVSGPLITRPVNVGDRVEAGNVVARIDPQDYKVELSNTEGQLENAKATLTKAESDLARQLRIMKQDAGATSQAAIDKARESRDSAKAAIKSYQASVQAAQDRLDYTQLQAPFGGTITATYVENFQTVQAKERVVRLLDNDKIKFDVDVPEKYISYVPTAQNITVVFDAFPGQRVPAELHEIGTEASTSTRTYPVTLMLDQPEGFRILAGMAGRARPEGNQVRDRGGIDAGVVIPVSAVFSNRRGLESFVWVLTPAGDGTSTASRRAITANQLVDTGILVKDGLSNGEWVATAGVNFLNEGQTVRILDAETLASPTTEQAVEQAAMSATRAAAGQEADK